MGLQSTVPSPPYTPDGPLSRPQRPTACLRGGARHGWPRGPRRPSILPMPAAPSLPRRVIKPARSLVHLQLQLQPTQQLHRPATTSGVALTLFVLAASSHSLSLSDAHGIHRRIFRPLLRQARQGNTTTNNSCSGSGSQIRGRRQPQLLAVRGSVCCSF